MYYHNGYEIIDEYDSLYRPVFHPAYLFHIFNDEHDYDVTEDDLKNEEIMLALGHYYSLKENNINKAKFYYNKVTDLGSAKGLYSISVFYYLNNMNSRARLCCENGMNMHTNGSYDCILLLHKMSVKENNNDRANKYFLDEIERIENLEYQNKSSSTDIETKIKLIENICFFHLNVTKDTEMFKKISTKYINYSDRIRAIVVKYHYDSKNDVDMLACMNPFIENKSVIGIFFDGMYNYLLFSKFFDSQQNTVTEYLLQNICNNEQLDTINKLIDLIKKSKECFENVASSENTELHEYSYNMITKCEEIVKLFSNKTV